MPLAVHFKNRCFRSVIRTRLHVSPSRSHNRRACASVSLSPGISRYSPSIRSSSVEIRGVSRVCVRGRRSRAWGSVIGCCSRAARAAPRACSVDARRRAASGWLGSDLRDGTAVVVSGILLCEANTSPRGDLAKRGRRPKHWNDLQSHHLFRARPGRPKAFFMKDRATI